MDRQVREALLNMWENGDIDDKAWVEEQADKVLLEAIRRRCG